MVFNVQSHTVLFGQKNTIHIYIAAPSHPAFHAPLLPPCKVTTFCPWSQGIIVRYRVIQSIQEETHTQLQQLDI